LKRKRLCLTPIATRHAHPDPLPRVLPRVTPAPPWRATGRFVQQTITAVGAGWGSSADGRGHGWSLLALEALRLKEYEEVVLLDQKVRTASLSCRTASYVCCVLCAAARVACDSRKPLKQKQHRLGRSVSVLRLAMFIESRIDLISCHVVSCHIMSCHVMSRAFLGMAWHGMASHALFFFLHLSLLPVIFLMCDTTPLCNSNGDTTQYNTAQQNATRLISYAPRSVG